MKAKHAAIALVWAASLVGVGLWAQAPGGESYSVAWGADGEPTIRQFPPAQFPGSVTGTVQDSTGGAIPGARVALIDEAGGSRSMPVVTDDSGNFAFRNVSPGTYTIEVTMPGFRPLERRRIVVSSGEAAMVQALVMEAAGQFRVEPRRLPQVPGAAVGALITSDDIAFQPVDSPNAPAGTVAGRWMVRINGRWYEASGATQLRPLR